MDCWSASEQEGLRRLQRKWEHRAAGRDARFNAIGVVAGINNRFRPRTGADALANIQRAIAESNARLDGTQGVQPGLLHVYDKKWPMGRPVVKG